MKRLSDSERLSIPNRLPNSDSFTVPLSPSAHQLARQFSRQRHHPQKAKQIYLNTLAVSAVEFYLRCMGLETAWPASQSRNPIIQSTLDVADLTLPGKGRLECLSLLPDTSVIPIPPEAWRDRLGYVAVQLAPSLQEATLLGFAPAGCQEIAIETLQSLDALMVYLHQIQPEAAGRVQLSQWLDNLFEAGWQSLTALTGLDQPRLATAFRNDVFLDETAVRRAKLIDLGVQLGFESVALLVAITPLEADAPDPETPPRVEIWVQIHPASDNHFLHPNIRLSLISEAGETLQMVTSRHQDNYIQLKRFRGVSGECFDIKVASDETCTTEAFII